MCQDQSYKRVVNENLWNESSRLSPKFAHFHITDHSFRFQTMDLEEIENEEKEEIHSRLE